MARTLKTFVVDSGFFQLAVAAPSMKAALAAWGMTHNAFADGVARQTQEARVVAAAMAQPGQVLRRPLTGKGEFRQDAALPTVKPSAAAKKQKAAARPKADPAAIRRAQAALDAATRAHDRRARQIAGEIAELQQRAKDEDEDWAAEHARLTAAVVEVRKGSK